MDDDTNHTHPDITPLHIVTPRPTIEIGSSKEERPTAERGEPPIGIDEDALVREFEAMTPAQQTSLLEEMRRQAQGDGSRDALGHFTKGHSGHPQGTVKGTLSKLGKMKEDFLTAYDRLGGVDGLVTWAQANPSQFYLMMYRMIPRSPDPDDEGDREGREIWSYEMRVRALSDMMNPKKAIADITPPTKPSQGADPTRGHGDYYED